MSHLPFHARLSGNRCLYKQDYKPSFGIITSTRSSAYRNYRTTRVHVVIILDGNGSLGVFISFTCHCSGGAMGYDIKRFLNVINEGLLCCICQNVLQDAVQTPCEHAFCRACILAWLSKENSCPVDRHPVSVRNLHPLFLYMRSHLNKLRIRCKNNKNGCGFSCNLEFISGHERVCMYDSMSCPNKDCSRTILKMELSDHLKDCAQKPKLCNNGCGLPLMSADAREHNCITQLQKAIEILRSEMIRQMESQRKDMEERLSSQREQMLQREAAMQTEIVTLKNEISRISQKVKLLLDLEERRRSDFERMETERKELFIMLKNLQKQSRSAPCPNCQPRNGGKVTTI